MGKKVRVFYLWFYSRTRRAVFSIARQNSDLQYSRERNTQLSLKMYHLCFPDNPKWSDVEPYYLRDYQPGHALTYMVKDAGGVPQPYRVNDISDDKTVLEFLFPNSQIFYIGKDVSNQYSPKSLKQTQTDLASSTGMPEHSFDFRGSTGLAFLWLFLFGSTEDRRIVKFFAEKPGVLYVDVEKIRLMLVGNNSK